MGKNNRARRAAKQRFRRHHSSANAGSTTPDLVTAARNLVVDAITRASFGHDVSVTVPALVTGPFADRPGPVDLAVAELTGEITASLFRVGWTPVDLVEHARRVLDRIGVDFVRDAVSSTTGKFPSALVHPRWERLLATATAGTWWDGAFPLLSDWASRHGSDRTAALTTVLSVLHELDRLPPIEVSVPAPGQPAARSAASVAGVDGRMLAKVQALLRKAEASEFEAEAETLSAKAQDLMTRYSLTHAVRASVAGGPSPVGLRRMWIDAPYVDAKALLIGAVADANRCGSVLCAAWGHTTIVGDELDLDLVELLSTSLLVQATRHMLRGGAAGHRRVRSYRRSFLFSYALRIGERLRQANDHATEDVVGADADLLPVLAARHRDVDERLAAAFPLRADRTISVSNAAGWSDGRAAADLALFDVRDVLSAPAQASQRAG